MKINIKNLHALRSVLLKVNSLVCSLTNFQNTLPIAHKSLFQNY